MQILTNCPGWMHGFTGPFQMVDGLQRVTAVLAFMNNKLTVFDGHLYQDFSDNLREIDPSFDWYVNDLKTREEVLQWYIDLNTGGTVDSQEEIDRVRVLLEAEKRRE